MRIIKGGSVRKKGFASSKNFFSIRGLGLDGTSLDSNIEKVRGKNLN